MRRSPMKRSNKPMRRTAMPGRTKRINKFGARGRAWSQVWAFLKVRFYKAGRTSCEFDFVPHDCWGALYPCHSKKRRKMEGNDIYVVAVGCQQIARWLDEDLTHEAMEKTVWKAIENHGGLILPD